MKRARPRRLFARQRRLPRIGLLHLLAAIAVLAACAPRTESWSPAESPKRNLVNWAEFHHSVGFAAGSAEIAPAEGAALDRFLARVADGDRVHIGIASGDRGQTALALRREAAVAAHLRQRGYQPRLSAAPPAGLDGVVGVTVARYVVTPPRCPDWTKPADGDTANTLSSNHGCATTSNLGLMVADPGVLVRGYATGPADGEAMAKSIQNYRENKTPWLPATAGFEMRSSTGGDQNSGSGNGNQ